jgi:hypothetical protein
VRRAFRTSRARWLPRRRTTSWSPGQGGGGGRRRRPSARVRMPPAPLDDACVASSRGSREQRTSKSPPATRRTERPATTQPSERGRRRSGFSAGIRLSKTPSNSARPEVMAIAVGAAREDPPNGESTWGEPRGLRLGSQRVDASRLRRA